MEAEVDDQVDQVSNEMFEKFEIRILKSNEINSKEEACEETLRRVQVVERLIGELPDELLKKRDEKSKFIRDCVVYRRIIHSLKTWKRSWRLSVCDVISSTPFMGSI